MSTLRYSNKSQGPYYVVEVEDESNDSSNSVEYEFNNHEHNYCINDYSKLANKKLVYVKESNNSTQFQTLANVEPNLVFVTYLPNEVDGTQLTNAVEGMQDDVGNTVQIYGANDLVQNVFVHNGEVEFVNEEVSEDTITGDVPEPDDNIQDQEETEQLEDHIHSDADIVHKVNGTEIWIMVEDPVKDDSVDNVDETQIEDCTMDERVVSDETYEVDTSEWLIQKPKVKSKTVVKPKRRLSVKKEGLCIDKEINEEIKHYDKVIKKAQKRSWVWKYFSKQGEVIYQCSLCQCNLSIKGCNTNNMNRHIRTKHFSIYNMEVESKPVVIGESENSDKNEAEDIVVCNTYKSMLPSTDDSDGSLFKQRWRSWVWWLFDQVSSTVARCKLCKRKITHGGTATGNLNRHIKLLHKEVYLEVASSNKLARRASQKDTSPDSDNFVLDIQDVHSFEEAWESFQCKDILRKRTLCEQ